MAGAAEPDGTAKVDPTAGGVDTPTGSNEWAAGVQRIRDTSSWITKAGIAAGTLLVGGGPLVGDLTGVSGWGWASVWLGILVAVAGCGIVIHAASNVMLPVYISDKDLDPAQGESPAIAEAKSYALNALWDERVDATAANNFAGMAASESDATERANLQRLADRNNTTAADWHAVSTSWIRMLGYMRLRDTFMTARRSMFVGAVLVVLGVGVYLATVGGVTAPDKPKVSEAASAPGAAADAKPAVQVFTWADGQDGFRGVLNLAVPACNRMSVIVNSGSGAANEPWDLTATPDASCAASVRFRATSSEGVVTAPIPVVTQPALPAAAPADRSFVAAAWEWIIARVVTGLVLIVVLGAAALIGWWYRSRSD